MRPSSNAIRERRCFVLEAAALHSVLALVDNQRARPGPDRAQLPLLRRRRRSKGEVQTGRDNERASDDEDDRNWRREPRRHGYGGRSKPGHDGKRASTEIVFRRLGSVDDRSNDPSDQGHRGDNDDKKQVRLFEHECPHRPRSSLSNSNGSICILNCNH